MNFSPFLSVAKRFSKSSTAPTHLRDGLLIRLKAATTTLVPRADSSPAKHQNHGIWPLQVRKLATFARVIGQLIIGKYRASYDVRSHKTSSERLGIMNFVFWVSIISAHRLQS